MTRTLNIALVAGAALFVAACGGGAANNTASANDAGTVVSNEPTMAPMNEGMPADNNAMTAPAPAPVDNATAPAGNSANHM